MNNKPIVKNVKKKARRPKAKKVTVEKVVSLPSKPKVRRAKPRRSGAKRAPPVTYQKAKRFTLYKVNNSSDGNSVTIEGHDYVDAISIPGSNYQAPGSVLANLAFSPGFFADTRMQKFAQLYERWEPIDVSVEFCPAGGSNQPGTLVGYWDYDVNDVVPSDINVALKVAWGHETCSETPFMRGHTWTLRKQDDWGRNGDFYTTPSLSTLDPHDNALKWFCPGRFIALVSVGPNPPPTAYPYAFGDLFIKFKIRFYMPQIEKPDDIVLGKTLIPPSPSGTYINIPLACSLSPSEPLINRIPLLLDRTVHLDPDGANIPVQTVTFPPESQGTDMMVSFFTQATSFAGPDQVPFHLIVGTTEPGALSDLFITYENTAKSASGICTFRNYAGETYKDYAWYLGALYDAGSALSWSTSFFVNTIGKHSYEPYMPNLLSLKPKAFADKVIAYRFMFKNGEVYLRPCVTTKEIVEPFTFTPQHRLSSFSYSGTTLEHGFSLPKG